MPLMQYRRRRSQAPSVSQSHLQWRSECLRPNANETGNLRHPSHPGLRRICIRRLLAIPARESYSSRDSRCDPITVKREAIFATHLAKSPQGPDNPACRLPELVLAAFEMCDEQSVLNSHDRVEIQAANDGWQVQIVDLAELSGTQPMVAVLSCPMVRRAKWDRRRIW
jgi:hypothetical protein